MSVSRRLAAAAPTAISVAAVALSAAGLAGMRSGWLDVINNFAPMILAMALVGGGLACRSLHSGATRAATLALALMAALYGLALIVPEVIRWSPAPPVSGMQFRVLSANVWFGNPSPDLAVSDILARNADAVLLQEANGAIRSEIPRLQSQYPYASACAGSGVLILVRTPIVASGCGLGPRAKTALDLVWVRTSAPDGQPVTLATTHLSWPLSPGAQKAEREGLAVRLGELPSDDMILAGDFNTTPWSFAMRRQDKSFRPMTRRTIAWFSWPARLDALRWPWPLPILPIDHIYAGPGWGQPHLTRLRMPGSDHFATEAVFSGRR
jgi:endonuclease/exonuclease/phosphatase (EEP) superfamily protein YafD